ncbi:O-acetyl-ADP-ribose deacetylase [Terasakiella sp. SH-1]|uniref:O-acetyl-ADP-ribose deacetylase n=1 Tax=Terasakiella sp. SH-1 TaxID=2560057 RepID=UPI001073EA99|nr:O-acetyl-ADP-ribose deacetylase [Terasakiella sp. SH-1]
MARLRVIEGDITTLDVDVIVNAANPTLLGGGGVDGAIHRAAGPALLDECRTLGGCETGQAKITSGYHLKAPHIIHTVGPIWHQYFPEEADQLLAACYENSLKLCLKNSLQVIAFPAISTGIYGFPAERAARLVVQTVAQFCDNHSEIKEVIFCCFDPESKALHQSALDHL